MKPDAAPTILLGQLCWYVSAGGVTAPSFTLVLGDMIPRKRVLKNTAHPLEFRENNGSVEFLIWCSWRVQRGSKLLASSAQEESELQVLRQIQGSKVVDACCSPPAWDFWIRFSNDLELAVFCDHIESDSSIPQNWELWGPQGYVGTGPGATWTEDPTTPG